MHLAILKANFDSYQLNNCNWLFSCLSDITKLFCCHLNGREGKLSFIYFPAKLACLRICPVELSPTKLSCFEKRYCLNRYCT